MFLYGGTPARSVLKPVDDCILAALGAEQGIANFIVLAGKINGEALLGSKKLVPVYLSQFAI